MGCAASHPGTLPSKYPRSADEGTAEDGPSPRPLRADRGERFVRRRLSVVDDGEMEADWPDDSPPLRSYGEGRFMDPDGTSFQRGIRMEWGLFVTPSEDDGTLHPACPSSFSSEPAIRTPALAPAPRRAKSVVVTPQSARFLTSASLRRTTGSFRGMACAPVAARLVPCARSTRTGLASLCTPPTTH